MKRKIVLWGTNEKEEKILVALHLLDTEGKVNIYTFSENLATEDFYNQMLNQWRDNKEVDFPEGFSKIERPLTVTDNILPDDIKVERTDIINRAKTEWHFVVLSSKLYDMYRTELDDLSDTIENLKEYDNKMWIEMRNFWSKVQEQVIEKNLFREQATTLKSKTNQLFDRLKELKKKVEAEFETVSTKYKEEAMADLTDIESRVEKGLGLKPIFEELKSLQGKIKGMKFTKKDRNDVWKKLDDTFKTVKEKRFGDQSNSGNSPYARLTRRYEGLVKAIGNMEKSIARDKDDEKFQNRKIATTDGQLEMQIRQAKLKMIEERVRSKEVKLADMYETKKDLESKIAKEKAKEEKKAKMDQAKAAAEAKISAEVKKSAEVVEASADKLEEASQKIAEGKKAKAKTPPIAVSEPAEEATKKENAAVTEETKAEEETPADAEEEKGNNDTILGAIAAIAGEALDNVGEALEDVVDTVKAVAEVVEDKIEDALEDAKGDEEE